MDLKSRYLARGRAILHFAFCIFAMNQLRRISDIAALYIEWCAADIGVVVGSGCLSQVFCATEAR